MCFHFAARDDGEFSLRVIETLDHENLISNRNLIDELRQGSSFDRSGAPARLPRECASRRSSLEVAVTRCPFFCSAANSSLVGIWKSSALRPSREIGKSTRGAEVLQKPLSSARVSSGTSVSPKSLEVLFAIRIRCRFPSRFPIRLCCRTPTSSPRTPSTKAAAPRGRCSTCCFDVPGDRSDLISDR